MNKEKIQEMSLHSAIYNILSSNDSNLTPEQILIEWKEGREVEDATVCVTYEDFDPEYLAEECESLTNQFVSFAEWVLEEASK